MQVAGLAHDAMHTLPLRTGTTIQAGLRLDMESANKRAALLVLSLMSPCLVCSTSAWPLATSWLMFVARGGTPGPEPRSLIQPVFGYKNQNSKKKFRHLYGDLNLNEIKNALRLLSVNGETNLMNLIRL